MIHEYRFMELEFNVCSVSITDELLFLHFGTSSEVLDHLSGADSALVGHRHLCSIPATTASNIAASSIILSSKIAPGVSVAEDSLIYNSSISSGIQIGSLSIVVGLNVPEFIDVSVNLDNIYASRSPLCLGGAVI